jgi:acetate kinase
MKVLVVNAGSSSLKLRLLGPDDTVAEKQQRLHVVGLLVETTAEPAGWSTFG